MMKEHTNGIPASAEFSSRTDAPWLRFYDDDVPEHPELRNLPVYAWLDETAEREPAAPACAWHGWRMSYARLRKDAERIAANLAAHGVKPGDRVGIMLPNLPHTLLAFWGALKAGGVVVMINPVYMEKDLTHQVRDAGITHMICYDGCWPKLAGIRERIGTEKFFIVTPTQGFPFPWNLVHAARRIWGKKPEQAPYDGKTVFPFSSLLKGKQRLSVPVEHPEKTLALLQYTGGTTGLSKGAMLTHANVTANIQQIGCTFASLRESRQTFMAVLPFFHVYGLNTCLILPTFFHARVVPVTRFAPQELLLGMKKYRATILPGAPSMYIALLQQKNKDPSFLKTLKVCISGSAPMPADMQRLFEKCFGARLIEGYGLSEASPITHLTPMRGLRKVGSIGPPLPGTEARIVDMEVGTLPLPPGKTGELVIRGPQVMTGYWNNPDETAGALRNGWLYTGDIASMDEEGYFTILDRKKDMIIVGGYNVSPREIDEVLLEHPKVRDAVSVGVPHPSRGEVIKAYIVLKDGERCERSEIVGWCRARLAGYKTPRRIEFRSELPKTLVGKVLRRVLRAEEEEKQRRAAGASPGVAPDHFPGAAEPEKDSPPASAP